MNVKAPEQVEQQLAEEIPSRKQSRHKLYNLAGWIFAWGFVFATAFACYLLSLFFFGEAYFYRELGGPGDGAIVMRREYKYCTVAQLYIPAAWTIGRATGSPVHLTAEDDALFYFNSHEDQQ